MISEPGAHDDPFASRWSVAESLDHHLPDADTISNLCYEGLPLLELFFHRARQWCLRRALLLEFLQERRGEWSNLVDFEVPDVRGSELLNPENSGRIRLPLFTFSKDLLPPAHVHTRDETGTWLSLEESSTGRQFSYAILLATANQAELCMTCAPAVLWHLTSSDTVLAHKAWCELYTLLHVEPHPVGGPWVPNAHFSEFVMLARLIYRSAFLMVSLSEDDVGARKIVTLRHDGPIRVTRRLRERFGLSPLRIAPRATFGGNAQSYHVQILPAERLTVVDSRLLYAYYAREATSCTPDRPLIGKDILLEEGRLAAPLRLDCQRQWWGNVEGPAEPMTPHVRCSQSQMPDLQAGRDCYGIFQLYPQFAGLLSQFLIAGTTNFLFVAAFVLGLQFRQLRPLLAFQPEVVFIVAALVAGFGVGLTLYPKEHVLTSAVLRPWRIMEALLIAVTIAVPVTSVWNWSHQAKNGKDLPVPLFALWTEVAFGLAILLLLFAASYSPWVTETTGGRAWRRTGLRLRRAGYPRRGQVIDDRDVARREMDPEWASWVQKREQREEAKVKRLERSFARRYLVEGTRHDLFNRGIPPASRHGRNQRSW